MVHFLYFKYTTDFSISIRLHYYLYTTGSFDGPKDNGSFAAKRMTPPEVEGDILKRTLKAKKRKLNITQHKEKNLKGFFSDDTYFLLDNIHPLIDFF